jgi:hypothetical protein
MRFRVFNASSTYFITLWHKVPGTFFVGVLTLCGACASSTKSENGASPETPRESIEQIRAVIGANLRRFAPCYERAIDERPGAAGRMVVQWSLSRDGIPTDVAIKESHESLKGAEECVLAEVRKFRFDSRDSDEILEIIYPFFFSENGMLPNRKKSGGG